MINYTEKIPNNVDLGRDRVLQRALEHWQPAYMGWWYDMGPNESHNYEVYLRTATSVEPDGWAQFGYVKMPDYRWGIFLQPRDEKREVNFGIHKGQSAWQEVPGEYRSTLRRVIVTQGDTEPASVEQQRMLGSSCPSMYDLRNIFQVNVERKSTRLNSSHGYISYAVFCLKKKKNPGHTSRLPTYSDTVQT